MRETTPSAMPPCFDRWCKKFDDLLRTKAQKAVRGDGETSTNYRQLLAAQYQTRKVSPIHPCGGFLR